MITGHTVTHGYHHVGADGLVDKMASMAKQHGHRCVQHVQRGDHVVSYYPWLSLLEPRRARRALQLVRITLYPIVAIPWTKLS